MADKQLTASVRLNTTQFEQKLKHIARGIDALNNSVGKQSNAYQQVNSALQKTDRIVADVKKKTDNTKRSTDKWVSSLNAATGKLTQCKSLVGALTSKVAGLAGTLLGIGSITLAIQGADTLTGAQNRFNNIAAQQIGDSAYKKDSSGNITGYSKQALEFTQDVMDKIYTSAQKTRVEYADMLSNVSKTMTLAPDAFQGNIDNAIRFQEIMAEAYAVGGASAQEMSTSMYQLTQALGAGTLAGDELRSVREGAPLAYQKIEEFAQGVFDTEESLKDLASQGKITSDLVVAAVMDMGSEMDTAFALTKYRFTDVWNQIKSAAQKTFSPVVEMLTDKLNEAVNNGLVQKFETFFANIAKAVMIAFTIIEKAIKWIAENWNWLKDIIVVGLILIMTYEAALIAARIVHAATDIALWIAENAAAWAFLLTIIKIIAVIALVVIGVYLLWQVWSDFANGAITLGNAIIKTLLIIGVIGMLIAFIFGGWIVGLIILAVALILAAIVYFFAYVAGAATWLGAFLKNVGLAVANFFIAVGLWLVAAFKNCIEWIVTAFNNAINWICNLALGLWNSIKAIAQNIGIAFENAWIAAQNAFWSFIQSCLEGIRWLEPAINAIAEAFGKKGFTLSGVIDNISGKQKSYKSYTSVSDAWSSGYNTYGYESGEYESLIDAWNKGINTLDAFQEGWSSEAFNIGYEWGSNLMDYQLQSSGESTKEKTSWLDDLGNKLGLSDQFDNLNNTGAEKLLSPDSTDDLLSGVNDTAANTGKMADSMELAEEDLSYLRKVAEMEWKKEFTTANIKIDMSNYNTVNGESDLDGIVTKLADKLYEEMNVVANGVYV